MFRPSRDGGDSTDGKRARWLAWAVLAVAIVFAVVVRVRLLNIPLERDEGDFAYAGRLILHGISPYKLAYNMKFPGIYAAYAASMAAFGQTVRGIHMGLLVTNLATILMVFLLGRRLRDSLTGALAALCYAILSVSPCVFGTFAHATNFVVLPALAGLLLLLPAKRPIGFARLIASGVLLGLAYLMKQPGAMFGLAGLIIVVWPQADQPRNLSHTVLRASVFIIALLLLFAVCCVIFLRTGTLDKFWFWTFDYGTKFASMQTPRMIVENVIRAFQRVVLPFAIVWCLALVGILAGIWDKRIRPSVVFLWAFSIASIIAVSAAFEFRPHYFVLILPAVCIAAAIAARGCSLSRLRLGPVVGTALLLIGLIYPIYQQSGFLFQLPPATACRALYGTNPFPEAVQIGNYIREHSKPTDQMAILGSEAEIFFYANRRSATPYIFSFAFVENQPYAARMQDEAIGQIERAKPKFLVLVGISQSWCVAPGADMHIWQWGQGYAQRYYNMVGVVEVRPDGTTAVWGSDADTYEMDSSRSIYIFQRRPGA